MKRQKQQQKRRPTQASRQTGGGKESSRSLPTSGAFEKHLTDIVINFSQFLRKTFNSLINSRKAIQSKEGKDGANKWEYEAIGPVSNLIKQILLSLELITQNSIPAPSNSILDSINSLESTISQELENLGIEMSQALSQTKKVMFPSEGKEVYIGQYKINQEIHQSQESQEITSKSPVLQQMKIKNQDKLIMNGQGYWTDGRRIYCGAWLLNKRNGFGVQIFSDGSRYKGMWEDDKPLVGVWTLADHTQFYGRRGTNRRGKAADWFIGLTKDDQRAMKVAASKGDGKKEPKVINYLYYQGTKTGLANLDYHQKIDIQALIGSGGTVKGFKSSSGKKGGSKKGSYGDSSRNRPPRRTTTGLGRSTKIRWINGIEYEGKWENFIPSTIGKFRIPIPGQTNQIQGFRHIDVICINQKLIPFKSCTPHSVDEILAQRRIRLEFFGKGYYDGHVNKELLFTGFGELGGVDEGDPHFGIMDSSGMVFKLEDVHGKETEWFRKVGLDFLKDSQSYMRDHPELGTEIPWIKMIGQAPQEEQGLFNDYKTENCLIYKGHWKDMTISGDENGSCRVIYKGKEIQAKIDSDGSVVCCKNLNYVELLTGGVDYLSKPIHIEYTNGNVYDGLYNVTVSQAAGVGKLTLQNGETRHGIWEENRLVFDFDLIVFNESVKYSELLLKGEHEVLYKNGITFSGEWQNYQWVKGTIIFNKGAENEKREPWDSSKVYLNKTEKQKNNFYPDLRILIYAFTLNKNLISVYNNSQNGSISFKCSMDKNMVFKNLVDKGIVEKLSSSYKLTLSCLVDENDSNSTLWLNLENETDSLKLKDVVRDINVMHGEHLLRLDEMNLYDERILSNKIQNIDQLNDDHLKEIFQDRVVFKATSYASRTKGKPIGVEKTANQGLEPSPQNQSPETALQNAESRETSQLEKDDKKAGPAPPVLDKSLSVKPYIQISRSGLFKATQDLFRIPDECITGKYPKARYSTLLETVYNRQAFYAMFELNKLNGIKEVTHNSIKFFNGDIYYFENDERSYLYSLGSLQTTKVKKSTSSTFGKIGQNLGSLMTSLVKSGKKTVDEINEEASGRSFTYWKKFFNSCVLSNIDQEYFEKQLRNELLECDLVGMNPVRVKYTNGADYTSTWCHYNDFGNGKLIAPISVPSPTLNASNPHRGLQKKVNYEGFFCKAYRVDPKPIPELIENFCSTVQLPLHAATMMGDLFINFTSPIESLLPGNEYELDDIEEQEKVEPEIKAEFSYTIGDKVSKDLFDIILYFQAHEEQDNTMLIDFEANYHNGDYFKGKKLVSGHMHGTGFYNWCEGYSYEGNFVLSRPTGPGKYVDCMGTEREGFFFNGLRLDQDYGLANLIQHLETKYMVKEDKNRGVIKFGDELLKLVQDPELVKGSGLFPDHPLQFVHILEDMARAEEELRRDHQIIMDGERDYDYHWFDRFKNDIKQKLMRDELEEERKRGVKHVMVVLESDAARAREEEELKQRQQAERDALKTEMTRWREGVESEYKWMLEVDPAKPKAFEKELIIELFKDSSYRGIHHIFKLFSIKKLVPKLLGIQDEIGRNILMIAGYYGHRQVFLDLVVKLNRLESSGIITTDYLRRFVVHRDVEGNNTVDLLCIRGFNVKDQDFYSHREAKIKGMGILSSRIKTRDDSKFINKKAVQQADIDSNELFNHVLEHLADQKDEKGQERKLFSQQLVTFESFGEFLETWKERMEGQEGTSSMHFVSRRAFCLIAFFEGFKKFGNKKILEKKFYFGKRNNPLHFALFRGDLHTCVKLLEENTELMLWMNENGELAPDMIRWSGEHKNKARAVFASLLKEFTRNYNFYLIDKLFIGKNRIIDLEDKIEVPDDTEEAQSIGTNSFRAENALYKANSNQSPRKEVISKNHLSPEMRPPEVTNKPKMSLPGNSKQPNPKSRRECIKEALGANQFNSSNIYLYHNNYILLSDELCLQYTNLLKEKSKYRHLKSTFRMMQKYVFTEISELEALQRNLNDYTATRFRVPKNKELEEEIRSNVQKILAWYIYAFGDAEISPQTYTLMEINPFDMVFTGRNIFHFMCKNNSASLLKQFTNYLFERCHEVKFDSEVMEYEEWSKLYILPDKFNEFKRNLSIQTTIGRNTAAHLSVINKNLDCLEILMTYDIDLQILNFRGRSVRELLENLYPYNVGVSEYFTPEKVSDELLRWIKSDILTTCKQHSMTFEFADSNAERLEQILKITKFGLDTEQTLHKDKVTKYHKRYWNSYKAAYKGAIEYNSMLSLVTMLLDFQKSNEQSFLALYLPIKELAAFPEKRADLEKNEMMKFITQILPRERILKFLENFSAIFEGESHLYLPYKSVIKTLFNIHTLKYMEHFKYKRIEKLSKKRFLDELLKTDFTQPLPRELKDEFTMEQLFCIEIKLRPNEEIKDNPIFNQIDIIRKKYSEIGGGIKIDLIKGFDITEGFMCYKEVFSTWFILITVSDDLFKKVAAEEQMRAYNMLEQYHTIFSEDNIEQDELEPLRHSQKMEIVMMLVNQEFDIDSLTTKGIIAKYFPLHDYNKRNRIKTLWEKNKYTLHFLDLFTKTKDSTLQVLSLITFYHGIQQGFYFGFLSVYNNCLLLLSLVGIVISVLYYGFDMNRDICLLMTSVAVGLWSSLFMTLWKRREAELAFSFDAFEEEYDEDVSLQYRARSVIDTARLQISKYIHFGRIKEFFFTAALMGVAFIFVGLIYWRIDILLTNIDESTTLSENEKTIYNFAVGILNQILNFILAKVYIYLTVLLVKIENHPYVEDKLKSDVLKTTGFKLFSSLFTLIAQSLLKDFAYSFYMNQVLANIIASAFLNYGLSIGLPFYTYISSRYYFWSYLFRCGPCRCMNRYGRIEEFKSKIAAEMMADSNTRDSFHRYCLDELPLETPKMKRLIGEAEELVRSQQVTKRDKIGDKENKTDSNKLGDGSSSSRVNQVFPADSSVQQNLLRHSEGEMESKGTFGGQGDARSLVVLSQEAEAKLESIEKVEPSKKYKGTRYSSLGINKKSNIKLRLKEEFTKFVLGFEKIVETSYSLDLGSLENNFNESLLTQFTFIVFFSPFLIFAGAIGYVINLFVIVLTVRIYVKMSRRPISRQVKDNGIWNQLFNIVAYLAIIYNAVILSKLNDGINSVRNQELIGSSLPEDTQRRNSDHQDTEIIYGIQFGLLVVKVLAGMIVPALPATIKSRAMREKLTQERLRKKYSKILNRIGKEKGDVKGGGFDKGVFQDREGKALKHFFKNKGKVQKFVDIYGDKLNKTPTVKIRNARKDLL